MQIIGVKKYIVLITFLVISVFIVNSVYATENVISDDKKNNKQIISEEKIQKKEILNAINECSVQIKTNIKEINNKINELRGKNEYDQYPAIRLNVDTPLFGLNSIINNRLKITKDVSTIDIASGYSIKDVVNKKIIKLPSFNFASVVVFTREVKLDDSISLEDSNVALLYMIEYVEQTESVKEFLDNHINKIFNDYVSKEKRQNIQEINNKINDIKDTLNSKKNSFLSLELILQNNEEYSNLVKQYYNIFDKCYVIHETLSNILVSDDTVESNKKNIEDIERQANILGDDIDKLYKELVQDIDIISVLKYTRSSINEINIQLNKYVNSSKFVEDSNIEESKLDIQNDINIKNENKEKILYEVTSLETLNDISNVLKKIDEIIIKYSPSESQITDVPEEVVNKSDVINAHENGISDLTTEKKIELLEEIISMYYKVLSLENTFYLSNINYLLDETIIKVNDITKHSTKIPITETRYIYLELPDKLSELLNKNSTDEVLLLKRLTNLLKQEITNIVISNKIVIKIYDENVKYDKLS